MAEISERVHNSFLKQQFMKTLGASLLSVKPGAIEIGVPFRADLTQQNGFLHAGVMTTVLDSACGYAALSVAPAGTDVLSVEFKVNLLSPAVGERFVAKSTVKRAGRKLCVCVADAFAITGTEEHLIASMLSTIMIVESKTGSNPVSES